MANQDYIHGYTSAEKQRLIQQAKFWQDTLILREIDFQSGNSLLEIGCGVGAVLAILGKHYPHLNLSGIDLNKSQIDFAIRITRKFNNSDCLSSYCYKIN